MAEKQTTPLNFSGPAPDPEVKGGGFLADMFHSDLDQIKKWIDNTNPDSVRRAGQYYLAGKRVLDEAARKLKEQATQLSTHMKGPAAVETQKGLQSLHASMRELGAKLGEMGVPLTEYAETLRWAQANVVDSRYRHSRSDRGFEFSDFTPFAGISWAEDRARDHLEAVNKKIVEHYQKLPAEVQQALPTITPVNMPTFKPGGPTDYSGGIPSGSGSPYGPNGLDPTGLDPNGANLSGAYPKGLNPDGTYPNGLDPNGIDPNGLDPNGLYPNGLYPNGVNPNGAYPNGLNPDGTYPNGLNPNGLNPNGINPNGINPNGLDPSKTNLSLPDPNSTQLAGLDDQAMSRLSNPDLSTSAWPNSTAYQGPGNNTSGHGASGHGTSGGTGVYGMGSGGAVNAGTTGAGSRTAGNSGMPGMMPPMGGGGSGGQEEDTHESAYWLPEPDEYWTGPAKDVSPTTLA